MKLKKILIKGKKAYFFSLDALIALIIILGVVLVVKPQVTQTPPEIHLQEDLLTVLSSIKIGELDNAYSQRLIIEGKITNLNQSVLEQIGEFYASSDSEAELLAQAVLNQLAPEKNIGLYFNNIPIASYASTNFEDAKDIWTARQIISGIQEGESVRGYSSRAFLSASNKIDYIYFGGYVGDGNITIMLEDQISGLIVEAVFSEPFDVYINEQFTESHNPTLNVPYKFDLSEHLGKFSAGSNYLEFKGHNNLYIAGGYVKVRYDESEKLVSKIEHNLPGIEGLINIYDSIYIPGILNSMQVFLHYNSLYNIFLTIGDKTIYRGNSTGDMHITISNSELSSVLDYSDISYKTIPLRLGLENATYILNLTQAVDVFSVTDLSGSMDECVLNCSIGQPIKMIDLARDANKIFITTILNMLENRVGLVGYESYAKDEDYHILSTDETSLDYKVDNWKPGGGTCVCCGVNRAVQGLLNESDNSKMRAIVVMSDGRANVKCAEQGTGSALQDAIRAACDAYDNHGITVHTVGFGENADEETMQAMASCAHGGYYYSTVEDLIDLYKQIAEDIINASYFEQTVYSEGIHTILYSDSYISIDFQKTIPYGLVITAETPEFGNYISEGSFFVPNETQAYEVKVVSYSGSKWTDKAEVYNSSSLQWGNVFNLSEYGLNYIQLGDPYVVNIPIEKIKYGDNLIRVSTALSPQNSSGGSPYNKILYTLIKEISSYSPIVSSAVGCNWNIEFEDSTNLTIKVPLNYSGAKQCYYTTNNIAYNNNDAIDIAVYKLLASLDLNSNRKIETKFSENDLVLSSTEVEGIPFTWDTEVQVRVWR